MIKGIAIVKSTGNKSNCNSFGDSKIHIPANVTNKSSNDKFVKYAVLDVSRLITGLLPGARWRSVDNIERTGTSCCRSFIPRCFSCFQSHVLFCDI